MSLDERPMRLTKMGTVTVYPVKEGGVQIVSAGFDAEGASCRDTSVMACLWAIGELQREVLRTIERPGGGATGLAFELTGPAGPHRSRR